MYCFLFSSIFANLYQSCSNVYKNFVFYIRGNLNSPEKKNSFDRPSVKLYILVCYKFCCPVSKKMSNQSSTVKRDKKCLKSDKFEPLYEIIRVMMVTERLKILQLYFKYFLIFIILCITYVLFKHFLLHVRCSISRINSPLFFFNLI